MGEVNIEIKEEVKRITSKRVTQMLRGWGWDGGGGEGLERSRVPCQHNIELTFSTEILVNIRNNT